MRNATGVLLLVWAIFGAHSAFATVYAVKDLGVLTDLPARNSSRPNAISNNGKVAVSNLTNGVYRAFLYDRGWTNLGTLGGSNSYALGVNSSGEVVGRSLVADGATHAFLWTSGGTDGVPGNPEMKDLGTFNGGTHSEAVAVTEANQVTGYAQTSTRDHAFLYSGGTMTDVGAQLPHNLPNSYGLDVNAAGHIVGIAYDVFFTIPHAFYYNGSSGSDIGDLGVEGASALAINDNEEIAGYSNVTNLYVHAFSYSGGMMHDLGTLGGHYSYAIAINNRNVIVGGSFTDANDSVYHAFIAVSNVMTDLNSLLDATGNGWTLTEARGINDSGEIIGVGQLDAVNHGFLLDPVPEITKVEVNATNVFISFTTINAAPYALVSRDDLASSGWSNVVTGIIGTGDILTVTNSGGADRAQRFYRVSLAER